MTRTVLEIKDSAEPDEEAREWIEAISSVMAFEGSERADFLLGKTVGMARRQGARLPFAANTAYINTIPPHKEQPHPGNREIENRIRSAIRWNALALVVQTNRESAAQLVIIEHTVSRHLQNMFMKLGITSRAAATAYAYEHHLV